MKHQHFDVGTVGFYGAYWACAGGSDCAVIAMIGDDPEDRLARSAVKWLCGRGVNVLTMSPAKKDYLLCHAAFVLPAVFACYKTDGDLKKLKRDNAYLNRLIDANIEGYRAIRNAGHEILPDADKEFEDAAYRKTCFRFFKLMCATALGKICASDHAMNAVDEMSALNRDMKAFFDVTGAKYPVWKTLEAECGSYLR